MTEPRPTHTGPAAGRRARTLLAAAAVVLALALPAVPAVVAGPAPLDARSVITVQQAEADVNFLASDELEGRDTPSRGLDAAARYLAAECAAAGLQPGDRRGDRPDWFHEYPLWVSEPSAATLTLSGGDAEPRTFTMPADARPFRLASADLDTPIVFAGYGITSEEHGWDDYAGLDVEGKVVLILRHEPRETDPGSPFNGTASTVHATFDRKVENARAHGAAALLLVTDPLNHEGDAFVPTGVRSVGPDAPEATIPFLHVSRAFALEVFDRAGLDLVETQRSLDETMEPASRVLDVRCRLDLQVDTREVEVRNVAAWLPGSDADLADEVVVIGAHYDHVGVSPAGIHNGADDNASGTAAVLAAARAFGAAAEAGDGPRRSILFLWFSGEEKGLYGSWAYSRDPLVPHERTACMLNLDMVGRNETGQVNVMAAAHSDGLDDLIRRMCEPADLEPNIVGPDAGVPGNSDHYPFYANRVAVAFMNAGGHPDYHQPTDTPDKINHENLCRIAHLAYLVGRAAADRDRRFLWVDPARVRGPVHHVPEAAAAPLY